MSFALSVRIQRYFPPYSGLLKWYYRIEVLSKLKETYVPSLQVWKIRHPWSLSRIVTMIPYPRAHSLISKVASSALSVCSSPLPVWSSGFSTESGVSSCIMVRFFKLRMLIFLVSSFPLLVSSFLLFFSCCFFHWSFLQMSIEWPGFLQYLHGISNYVNFSFVIIFFFFTAFVFCMPWNFAVGAFHWTYIWIIKFFESTEFGIMSMFTVAQCFEFGDFEVSSSSN